MRRLLLSFLVFAFTLPAITQAKHPFTFEDMMKLKRVGDPQVSPDGKWVIFSVVDVDLEANTKTPHVWIVPLDHVGTAVPGRPAEQSSTGSSSAERILIADQDADRPRWAPDGKRFAFLSTKDGGSQVWIADFDEATGTVAQKYRLTLFPNGAGGELWSPDGKYILFTSDVYPECDGQADEAGCNAKKLDEANKSKVKAQIFDHLLYRHWNAYKEGKRTHIFVAPALAQVHVYHDLTPGDYDAPVFSLGGQDNYAFSPDGQEVCYASNHDKNPAASTNNDLWIVPIGGVGTGASPVQPKNITADNPASDSTPLYSPDGRYIAYRAQQRPGYESDRFRLMLYDRKTGEKTLRTEGIDQWIGSYAWSPDSKYIFYAAELEGGSPLYILGIYPEAVGWAGRKANQVRLLAAGSYDPNLKVMPQGFADDPAVTSDGKKLVYAAMSVRSPSEILECDLTKAISWGDVFSYCRSTALTRVNQPVLSHVAMSPLESFWFPGAHGDKVEGFVVKPPNFDGSKKYPVKFLIHGGPEGAWGDDWSYRWNPELFASPTSSTSSGYVVIMINFHGSTGYGQKFIDAINGDWGGAPFEDLMKGLDYAEQTYPFIDKNRECALGASYGGYAINWILGHTDRFKCLVSHDGMFNAESAWGTTEELWFNDWEFKGTPYDNRASYEKWSPHQYAKNFKTPTLVIHGQLDYRLDVSEGFQLFTTLQMEGIPSKMLYFPDEGHWVLKPQNSRLWYKTVNDWVDQWVGK